MAELSGATIPLEGTPTPTPDFDAVLQRIAVLEERTKPKRPKPLELVQAYGGVLALVISILYSFPLGIWDKFIEDPRKVEASTIASLKISLGEIYRLWSELGRVGATTEEPFARDMAMRGIQNQIMLIVTKNSSGYVLYRDKFSAEELVSVGLAFQSIYRPVDAMKFFEYALNSESRSEAATYEAQRQISKSYFFPSPVMDINKGRKMYVDLLKKTPPNGDYVKIHQHITLRSEWGLGELLSGDWRCGEENMTQAEVLLKNSQHLFNDGGNFLRMMTKAREQQQRKPNQPAEGCGISS